MEFKGEAGLILAIFVLVMLSFFVIFLFVLFVKRKNKLIEEQTKAKIDFEREISETQIEIREETLRNISWELHDNIGQLLTLTKIQLQNVDNPSKEVEESINTLGSCLTELRGLSKLINPETLSNLSLEEALKLELERYNRLKYIGASLECQGDVSTLNKKVEIIIFRMLQEFFTNTIKHAKATKLEVKLSAKDQVLKISARDNGIGFHPSMELLSNGIGLNNIRSRAKLIGADVDIDSQKDKGTQLSLTYKMK